MATKQFSDKVVVSDKLTTGMAKAKTGTPEELMKTVAMDEVPVDGSINLDQVASDASVSEQPLLMAKADIDLAATGEPASGAIVSDADVAYTDHITSDVAETVHDQPELLAMNTVQHLTDSTVLVGEEVAVGAAAASSGGFPWLLAGAGLAAGVGTGFAVGSSNNHDTVAPPAPSLDVAVVVEREGAFIDANANGVWDEGENSIANFQGGNADLEGKHVTIHFNDVPLDAINLTGFGADDKVQFDVAAFQDHGLLNASSNALTKLVADTGSSYTYFCFNSPSITLIRDTGHWWSTTMSMTDFNGVTHNGHYGLAAWDVQTVVHTASGGTSGHNGTGHTGIIAYWSDASNALNDQALVLPNYTGGNAAVVLDHLNAGTEGGVVEFVNLPPHEPHIDIVVEGGIAYIDQNGDGMLNSSDWVGACTGYYESAYFGCCGPGNSTHIDLASNEVTIHFHDAPYSPLDFSGFGSNDLIEIDINAYYWGNNNIARTKQNSTNSPYTSGPWIVENNTNWMTQTGPSPGSSTRVFGFIGVQGSSASIIIGAANTTNPVFHNSSVVAYMGAYNPVENGNVEFVYQALP